jgi:hypothetical protein
MDSSKGPGEPLDAQGQPDTPARREALRRLAAYSAFTVPLVMGVLTTDQAMAQVTIVIPP